MCFYGVLGGGWVYKCCNGVLGGMWTSAAMVFGVCVCVSMGCWEGCTSVTVVCWDVDQHCNSVLGCIRVSMGRRGVYKCCNGVLGCGPALQQCVGVHTCVSMGRKSVVMVCWDVDQCCNLSLIHI